MSAFAIIPTSIPYLELNVQIIDPKETGNPHPRSPLCPPNVGMDGHTLYFETDHPDFTLVLLDEDGEEAYMVSIPTTVEQITLPVSLTGSYELQLYNGTNFYFYCDIILL
jgi:hypothetical protein